MPDETDLLEIEEQTLIVPGALCVSPTASGANANANASKKRIRVGPSAGWMLPRGIMKWEHEISFVRRADATTDFLSALRGTLPHEQIAPKKYAMAAQAALASPLIPLASSLVAEARGQGVRVYTVGVDRVSAGFYYFAEGGAAEPVRWQGNLVEMLAPGLKANATNAEIEALLEGLIERLLLTFSDGSFSELDLELADALPRLARDGSGLQGTNLDAFDESARRLALQSAPWEGSARKIAEAVAGAGSTSGDTLRVPLYGDATREVRPALDVHFGGRTLRLADQPLWFVTGQPKEDEVPAAKPVAAPVAMPTTAVAVTGASSVARPAAASKGTLTGVAAPVIPDSAVPLPAVVPAPAPAVTAAAPRSPAVAATPAAPAVAPTAARISPPTPAAAITPSPVVLAAAAIPSSAAAAPEASLSASAPAKTEAVEAHPPAPAFAPATLAGPASELPASAPPAAEPPAPETPAALPEPVAASVEAPAAAVAEPASAEAGAPSEAESSEAIVPARDEKVVPAGRDQKALAKRKPFPYSTLLLVFALIYVVLKRFHVIH